MINYSDEGWQGRNWNTEILKQVQDDKHCEDMPGKSLGGFPSI